MSFKRGLELTFVVLAAVALGHPHLSTRDIPFEDYVIPKGKQTYFGYMFIYVPFPPVLGAYLHLNA